MLESLPNIVTCAGFLITCPCAEALGKYAIKLVSIQHYPSRLGSIYMLVLFRTSPGLWRKAPHPHANVWRLPVLADSRSNITMSPGIDLILSAGPVLAAGGGAGKVGRLGEVRNALTVVTRWKTMMPIGHLHLRWTRWRQVMTAVLQYPNE